MKHENFNAEEQTKLMKASELLVKCLENEGVEYIFGLPGEENIDVMDALIDSPIQFPPVILIDLWEDCELLCRFTQSAL